MSAELIKLNDFLPFMPRVSDEEYAATRKKDEFEFNGRKYALSTANTFDKGPETMLFSVKSDGDWDYRDLFCKRYDSMEAAHASHAALLADIPSLMAACWDKHVDDRKEDY